ncbi:GOLPH3/VPS74 family protein [Nocardia tengchongensis]|uniref:GOLPH3/VPS74 family protein n=1 Tax=Nocardia tengchongensis TaxID=2055889 RepID=UPI003613C7BC
MPPLIAEDLLWLLHSDDDGCCMIDRVALDPLLAGALLVELSTGTTAESIPPVTITDRGRWAPQVMATPHAVPGYRNQSDPVVVDAIAQIAARALSPARMITDCGRGLRATVSARLVADGRVRHERGRILGLVPFDAWPTLDLERKRALRHSMQRTLLDNHSPDPRTEALITLLSVVRAAGKQCPGWDAESIENLVRARGRRFVPKAAVAAVEAAVFNAQAGTFTGAA